MEDGEDGEGTWILASAVRSPIQLAESANQSHDDSAPSTPVIITVAHCKGALVHHPLASASAQHWTCQPEDMARPVRLVGPVQVESRHSDTEPVSFSHGHPVVVQSRCLSAGC